MNQIKIIRKKHIHSGDKEKSFSEIDVIMKEKLI